MRWILIIWFNQITIVTHYGHEWIYWRLLISYQWKVMFLGRYDLSSFNWIITKIQFRMRLLMMLSWCFSFITSMPILANSVTSALNSMISDLKFAHWNPRYLVVKYRYYFFQLLSQLNLYQSYLISRLASRRLLSYVIASIHHWDSVGVTGVLAKRTVLCYP